MFETVMDKINGLIQEGAASAMTATRFFEREIAAWKASEARQNQIAGERYYRGRHDILARKRTVIGRDGKLQEVGNLPNNRIVDNQYANMADQKTDYLFGRPFTIQTGNRDYEAALKGVFNRRFLRTLQNLGEDSLNGGIGWLYVFYDEAGKFGFRRFAPYEVLPFWRDSGHTVLDCVVRVYEVEAYEGEDRKAVEKAEIYREDGIEYYLVEDGRLVPESASAYMTLNDGAGGTAGYNWGRIPIVAFKYNDEEIPLICKVKTLQDSINLMLSDYQNNMQEDSRNTILIIKNYDGENLGEFRHNLAAYGAVKVRTIDGSEGGVEALRVEVDSENYKVLLETLKTALVENAKGFDAKLLKSGTPNQMNIKSMYSDIDLDANGMETEYQASFESLLWFVNAHLANSGAGNFEGEQVEIIFNRDMLMNESDVINDCRTSVGILSDETIVAQHPWVTDASAEMERIGQAGQEKADAYADSFPAHGQKG